ncbi:MAG: PadR family transcriptional regulator [archaeon]|nr:PadR family transcriptional regulator [archaeon]
MSKSTANDVFAPKGLLKMLILKIATMRATTGVEIMEEVPRMTNNVWSPSPGSVYYLLGEMEEAGLLIHVPTGETGIKRYISSEKGKLNLENFKLDAQKNLYKQMIMLKVLSDLADYGAVSDAISSLTNKIEVQN